MGWKGKFVGSMSDRADKPYHKSKVNRDYCQQFSPSGEKIPMAVHHITDWARLRDTWNRMVTDGHWGTISCWLYAVGFDVNNIYYETDAPQSPALIARTLQSGEEIDEKVADADEIHERVTWSTWNLVEGPKENTRTDDLGNFHDRFSNVRGLESEERAT